MVVVDHVLAKEGYGSLNLVDLAAGDVGMSLRTHAVPAGDGTFLPTSTHVTPPLWRQVQATDLDDDGQLDLVLAGLGGPIVLAGQGNGDFGPAVPFVGLGGHVVVGDVDQDGDTDMISGDATMNTGSGVHQLTLVRQLGAP